ncbi:MAG TPA: LamG domain-containing protein, partial [Verrucomicrobiae bacterium]|nr:LamG domain-containing protein [Verrucomicrobiae bacterium]
MKTILSSFPATIVLAAGALFAPLAAVPAHAGCTPPPTGIVGWWQAESNAVDIIGGDNGSVAAGVTYAAGETGFGFNFPGNANVTIPDEPALNPTNALTIELWVYVRAAVPSHWSQDLVNKDGECGSRQYMLNVGDSTASPGMGDFRAHIGVSSGLQIFDGATIIQSNTWYHVAETYDGTNLILYVNGNVDGKMAVSGPIITTTEPLRLGGGADPGCPAYYFNGMMDEVSIYNRALSSNQIAAIYQAGSA